MTPLASAILTILSDGCPALLMVAGKVERIRRWGAAHYQAVAEIGS